MKTIIKNQGMIQHWTFETLARADKDTLELIMRKGTAPEIEKLNGLIYCGWNCGSIGKLTGEKFKKGFCQKDGINYGFNETVVQDKQGYSGSWKMKPSQVRPFQMGYFRVSYVKEESISQSYNFYEHLALFNYKVPINKWHMSFFKVIRDFIVLPNENDHGLLLGKAYLQLWGKTRIACCYFLLGHPEKIQFIPPLLKQ
jgi:hypothetical protein